MNDVVAKGQKYLGEHPDTLDKIIDQGAAAFGVTAEQAAMAKNVAHSKLAAKPAAGAAAPAAGAPDAAPSAAPGAPAAAPAPTEPTATPAASEPAA
jgi:pyruvate dehydrogenase E2 component (dihydrolipoamide acetyltransferase)